MDRVVLQCICGGQNLPLSGPARFQPDPVVQGHLYLSSCSLEDRNYYHPVTIPFYKCEKGMEKARCLPVALLLINGRA